MNKRITSNSSLFTKQIGYQVALQVDSRKNNKSARLFLLKGDLGSGKTTFVLGFLKYFGIKPKSASPTFVIMKCYKPKLKASGIYHIDAYRLRSKKDLDVLGFKEISKNTKNIIIIEWPQRVGGLKMKNKTLISFFHGKKENERIIVIK
ncbi:MAG: tRNA (adenosine(37)-N6)-threonylcarbamoyltransferase complex ATPase subunit type 1 TsaE [Candidatus Paceibacterota bacterium]|jgi:tRNA threonylcarbamoyladenosine biosynthesis protein TsaE